MVYQLQFFPKEKCVVTGNPILEKFSKIAVKEKKGKTSVILVTGGSRGSQTVNELLQGILEKILSSCKVLHQSGQMDLGKFERIKESLTPELGKNYKVFANIGPDKMTDYLISSDIVVARAGANTVSEIIAAKKLSILIPIPFSYEDEQTKNALYAEKLGLSKILSQSEATPQRLLSEIEYLLSNWEKLSESIKDVKSPDEGASGRVVETLMEVTAK